MDFVNTKFFFKNKVLEQNIKTKNMSKKRHEKRKNEKMNSSTQKSFTLKNVWKIMIAKFEENHKFPKWVI